MRWAIQRAWRATGLCCCDEQQQQAAGHVRIWCKRFCAGVWCEGLDLQPGECRSCEIMMRKSHWSRERGWIKIGIMEDGWPTTLHGNIMRWIGHHLKPRCISKEVCNKDAVLSLAYFCTNRQVSQCFFPCPYSIFLKKIIYCYTLIFIIRRDNNCKLINLTILVYPIGKLQSLTWSHAVSFWLLSPPFLGFKYTNYPAKKKYTNYVLFHQLLNFIQ